MGLGKFLTSGYLRLNHQKQIIELDGSQSGIPFETISASEWGQIFEKYVGQIYEKEGYIVDYRGLKKGFLDAGIDIVGIKENEIVCIQCKYQKKPIGKSQIEWVLFKASRFLLNMSNSNAARKLKFVLVIETGTPFSKGIREYFLSKNHSQDKVIVEIRQISMKDDGI